MFEFTEFPKVPRLSRECVVTEKIDGTNAQVVIHYTAELDPSEDVPPHFTTTILDGTSYMIGAGSRTRWIVPGDDNHGFAGWVWEHKDELVKLGPGQHFGEWWGKGIQRNYSLTEKRFSLFNVSRWLDPLTRPECCHVVPVIALGGLFDAPFYIEKCLRWLKENGSAASPGFMKPEGIVVYHKAANLLFKKTLEKDEEYKGK